MSSFEIHLRTDELYIDVDPAAQGASPLHGSGLVNTSREAAEALGGLNELSFSLKTGKVHGNSMGQLSVMEEPAVLSLNMRNEDVDQVLTFASMSNGHFVISADLEEDQMGTWNVRSYRIKRRFG